MKRYLLTLLVFLTACTNPGAVSASPTSISTTTPSSTPASTEFIDKKGVPMRLILASEFTMGSDSDSTTSPAHRVYLDAFYIDKYEVTNARYADCVIASVCNPPHQTKSDFRPSYYGDPQYDNFPVIYIDWTVAKAYCEWRGARLPTEAEWEKAARGTDGRTYPWGEGISCEDANYDGDPASAVFCIGETSAVGSYESGKSPYGLYDMAGNAFEWTSSLLKPYPYNATDGREDLTRRGDRVIRGAVVHGTKARAINAPSIEAGSAQTYRKARPDFVVQGPRSSSRQTIVHKWSRVYLLSSFHTL